MPNKPAKQDCHESLNPIAWLEGRWITEEGQGSYPNTPSFQYHEELEFIYSEDEPLLDFMSIAKHSNKPLSLQERGYFHMPNSKRVQLITTHNNGYTTSEKGKYKHRLKQIKLKSVTIVMMSHVPRPYVRKTRRIFTLLAPDTLEYIYYKQTETTPMTQYLKGIYKKVD